jgi:hypothetical protein
MLELLLALHSLGRPKSSPINILQAQTIPGLEPTPPLRPISIGPSHAALTGIFFEKRVKKIKFEKGCRFGKF